MWFCQTKKTTNSLRREGHPVDERWPMIMGLDRGGHVLADALILMRKDLRYAVGKVIVLDAIDEESFREWPLAQYCPRPSG